ncbi:metal-dependent hydrolase [Anaeromicrobium sediminis]|uniref:UPF0173 metal-dependent hydrolase CCE28_18515 n=1 Tax=Anaeromicrobium sediminis TaxID=1478221 RepID=A0A267MDN0_9FIRM|nr:metal-dependent hydrolase [Anaeromicrobium sediminis]PAB57656.1 metal-dependent hydrolase [Anaeromicrobium sediminis]
MKIKFIAHSCFYIEHNNFKGLIDPFINGNPSAHVDISEFKDISHLFVTHGHGDHLGDSVYLGQHFNPLTISNFEICNYLSMHKLTCHPMHIGGSYNFDFGRVKMTPALHGSSIQTDTGDLYGGNPGGFLIEIDGKKIYHAGDTGLTMDMKLLEDEHIDLALIPIGGNFTMDIHDAVRAVDFIKPKKVIPMHYNTFDLVKADPEEFKNLIKNSEVIILNPSEEIEL